MKLISRKRLLIDIQKKKNKKVIGFTNGCFDLLHEGHKYNLKFCKTRCDLLIVALNSDNSVKKLKGDDRPIETLSKRIKNLSKIKSVNYIIYFSKSSVTHLIKEIKPDIIFKGGDYKGKKIDGDEFIKLNGGKIIYTPFKKGYSTTNIIKKFKLNKR